MTEKLRDDDQTRDEPQADETEAPAAVEPVVAEPATAASGDEPGAELVSDEPVAVIAGAATTVPIKATAETAPPTRRKERKAVERPAPKPLSTYAIVETGGKQYRVSVGDSLSVERLAIEAGSELTFDRVLLLGGDGATKVGTPVVDGAAVTARVDDHFRGEKIVVFKYKPKKRYRRRLGHRQSLTRLTITGISS